MNIAFFGSSLVSAYWNGAATYYRGLIRALHRRGHRVTFYEPDAFERQQHRDLPDPDWAKVVVYDADGRDGVDDALEQAKGADLVVKASGVGVHDVYLERACLDLRGSGTDVAFWDVDAPATLERVDGDDHDPFRPLIPRYDVIFTYGGGARVVEHYRKLGCRRCAPIYNALDIDTHHPVAPQPDYRTDLLFVGNRLPDRERRVDAFFFDAARVARSARFSLGGSGWGDRALPENVRYLGHVYTRDHNMLNCSARLVLNVSRASMARYGFSPATRVFEAAGAGACIVTDPWDGIEAFLTPGEEVLVARDGHEVAQFVAALSEADARTIGAAARRRIKAQHTYDHRAQDVERVLNGGDVQQLG